MNRSKRHLALAALVAGVVVGPAGGAPSAAPGISVVAWQPERLGTAVWRGGGKSVREVRFLRGARHAVLTPGATGVAYARITRGGLDLFLTGTYAGFEQPLAQLRGIRTTSLAFTPDGRTVAFAAPDGIGLVSIVPGARRRHVPLPARWRGSSFQGLAFSPDGRLLAFSRTWGDGRAGTLRNELAVVGRDGSGARSLARNHDPYGAQYRPTFSPDGARIAFTAADGSLATVPTAGGSVVRLTPPRSAGSRRTDTGPVYSRDGSLIAFTRSPGPGGSDVFLVGSDGSGLRRLTTTPLPEPGVPRVGSSALAWSPDGGSVLAFRHDHLAVVELRSGTSTAIAELGVQYEVGAALWH